MNRIKKEENAIRVSKLIRKGMIDKDITADLMAEKLSITTKTFKARLKNGTLSVNDLFVIDCLLGLNLISDKVA